MEENLYCSDCVHKEVCGLEGLLDEGMIFCASKMQNYLEQQSCDACISRRDMLDAIGHGTTYTSEELQRIIKGLPLAMPKTGHWEWVQYDSNPNIGNWHCSECRCVVVECVNKDEEGGIPLYKYCPQCGVKIE